MSRVPYSLSLAALPLAALLLAAPASASAQSLSPTLPSDTLEANFAPRSAPGPTPELAPTLPSDTLKLDEPGPWPSEGRQSQDEGAVWEEVWVESVRVTSRNRAPASET